MFHGIHYTFQQYAFFSYVQTHFKSTSFLRYSVDTLCFAVCHKLNTEFLLSTVFSESLYAYCIIHICYKKFYIQWNFFSQIRCMTYINHIWRSKLIHAFTYSCRSMFMNTCDNQYTTAFEKYCYFSVFSITVASRKSPCIHFVQTWLLTWTSRVLKYIL